MRRSLLALLAVVSLGSFACRAERRAAEQAPDPSYVPPAPRLQEAAPAAAPLVVFLGDSLTAGLGVDAEEAYPARVAAALAAAGTPIRAINAGVSGDTSAGGLARLDWVLRQRPAVLVVELGANDGLRGLPLAMTEANLRAILERARTGGTEVLLLGMQVPTNYGPDYARAFAGIYPRLARDLDVALVPFLLEGVGGEPELNQADGIHPTPAGHLKMAATVRPHLEALLQPAESPLAGKPTR